MSLSNHPRWVIAAGAAIASLGITGAALASDGADSRTLPDAVLLQDIVTVTATAQSAQGLVDVVPSAIVRADGDSFTIDSIATATNTLTASLSLTSDSPDSLASSDSVASVDTVDSLDSTDTLDSISLESSDSPDTTF